MKTNVILKLLAPLSHLSDEKTGTTSLARKMSFVCSGEVVEIPVLTGNALRGTLRRLAMEDFLIKVGLDVEKISKDLYHTLFSGGALTTGSRYYEVGEIKEFRKNCPMMALFGCALGSQMPEGKLKVGISIPICTETQEFTDVQTDLSIYDLLEENFYTRHDTSKLIKDIIDYPSKKDDKVTQMKYEQEQLIAGTELKTFFVVETTSDIEKSALCALIDLFKANPFIGGKSGTGHGNILVTTDELDMDSSLYYDYLEKYKEEIVKFIRELESNL
ncbi:MAG: hypothetical protein R3Y64_08755 [Peptostreptococcaceae bacterium]